MPARDFVRESRGKDTRRGESIYLQEEKKGQSVPERGGGNMIVRRGDHRCKTAEVSRGGGENFFKGSKRIRALKKKRKRELTSEIRY